MTSEATGVDGGVDPVRPCSLSAKGGDKDHCEGGEKKERGA